MLVRVGSYDILVHNRSFGLRMICKKSRFFFFFPHIFLLKTRQAAWGSRGGALSIRCPAHHGRLSRRAMPLPTFAPGRFSQGEFWFGNCLFFSARFWFERYPLLFNVFLPTPFYNDGCHSSSFLVRETFFFFREKQVACGHRGGALSVHPPTHH